MQVRMPKFVIVLLLAGIAQAQTAEQVLQKARDTYAAMRSYFDNGTVLVEYGTSSEDRYVFTTSFNRSPRHFLLESKQSPKETPRYVIWGDPDAFHTWWKTTGQQYDYPNPNNITAISGSERNTQGTSMKIPTLLYGKSALAAAMLALSDPVLDGTDQLAGHRCYRVVGRASDTYAATGKEVNVHRVSVWIDADTYLVRKVSEEWKALPGNRDRRTTLYDPKANPPIEEAQFKFSPPQGQ